MTEHPTPGGDGCYCTHHPDDPAHGDHCYAPMTKSPSSIEAWHAHINPLGGFDIEDADGRVICQRANWYHNAKRSIENAHLIAAAPDLLRALERIASGESDNAEKDAARAIAKAKNEGDGTHPNQMGPWS